MSGEVRRVRDCPYRRHLDRQVWPPDLSAFRCTLFGVRCTYHAQRPLQDCSRYRRHMSRAIHMPERRGPY